MVLVDTSVWVDHFRRGEPLLTKLLVDLQVLIHPLIIGELACGNLKNRTVILADLNTLPTVTSARHEEVLQLVSARALYGRGIGWIDSHLVASAILSKCSFWTHDQRLREAASSTGVGSFGS